MRKIIFCNFEVFLMSFFLLFTFNTVELKNMKNSKNKNTMYEECFDTKYYYYGSSIIFSLCFESIVTKFQIRSKYVFLFLTHSSIYFLGTIGIKETIKNDGLRISLRFARKQQFYRDRDLLILPYERYYVWRRLKTRCSRDVRATTDSFMHYGFLRVVI